jgi:hypothetical protein
MLNYLTLAVIKTSHYRKLEGKQNVVKYFWLLNKTSYTAKAETSMKLNLCHISKLSYILK